MMNKIRKFETISCPACNYEYLPSELYLPKIFFGNPEYIERDSTGKISGYSGTSINLFETYICDKCNTAFKVAAKIGFSTEIDKLGDFDADYSSLVNKNTLFLEED